MKQFYDIKTYKQYDTLHTKPLGISLPIAIGGG